MQKVKKRLFDLGVSIVAIMITWPIMLMAWVIASIDTRSNGLFKQKRVGKDGMLFNIYKIKTMRTLPDFKSSVTTSDDPRITKSGVFFRKTKIDELPQLFNVLLGQMSFVGPRPDVPGFADKLQGEDRDILKIAPGITGPASLKYKNEEDILAMQKDPEQYNKEVIWPDKVRINKKYMQEWSLRKDIKYIFETVLGQ